tara:strand:- start:850 stop:1524 length:675 start_codon:yes stop_codon:yes gene_type:complete
MMHLIMSNRKDNLHHGEYRTNKRRIEMLKLEEMAEIRPGYPFRGKVPITDDGEAYAVQFRHMVRDVISDKSGATLDRVNLTGKKKANFLLPGDVIFMAKGTRNLAAVIEEVPENTVCTPNFYHIRLKQGTNPLEPHFLAWQLNHSEAQRYFASCSQGSASTSITKAQLGSLSVSVPSLEEQNQIVSLIRAADQEKEILLQLIENRQRMIDSIGQQLLHPKQGKA